MILVSTDGSELSEKAIVTAAKLAKNLNTCVLGITVVKAKGSETAARTLDDVKDACQRVGVPCEVSEPLFLTPFLKLHRKEMFALSLWPAAD